MNRWARGAVALLLLAAIIAPLAWGATTAKTTFVFYVATSRSITATYGGQCTASAFFFNETDANFDPDIDGNGARVKPSAQRVTSNTTRDENFVGITSPSSTYSAYGGFSNSKPPTANNVPSNEINNTGYSNIASDDASYLTRETSIDGNAPILRTMFALGVDRTRVKDLNFLFIGLSSFNESPAVCTAGSTGSARDMNAYIWNFTTSAYDYFIGTDGGGTTLGAGGQTLNGVVMRDVRNASILNYISSDGNVIIITMGHVQANSDKSCFTADQAKLFVTYVPETTNYCQSSTLAPLTITNAGNVDINVDANFSNAFTGIDFNAVLKVWQGSSGCGSDGNGLGGWQDTCTYASPADSNTAPTTTSCRQYTKAQAGQYGRVATQLTAESAQQLCFSGDFNGFVPAGDHNNTFNQCVGVECSSDVTDSMLGWWKFNEGSGTTLQDSTIYNNDGDLKNSPAWVSGINCAAGGCLDFNAASTQYIEWATTADFNFDDYSAITVSFWAKSDRAGSPLEYIMGRGSDLQPFRVSINTGKMLLDIQNQSTAQNGIEWFNGDANITADGSMHHYAVVYGGADSAVQLYYDGLRTNLDDGIGSGLLCVACLGGTHRFYMATTDAGGGTASNSTFDGKLDDVRIYGRALSTEEVKAVMSHPQ